MSRCRVGHLGAKYRNVTFMVMESILDVSNHERDLKVRISIASENVNFEKGKLRVRSY